MTTTQINELARTRLTRLCLESLSAIGETELDDHARGSAERMAAAGHARGKWHDDGYIGEDGALEYVDNGETEMETNEITERQ